MTVEALMIQPVTLQVPVGVTRDENGAAFQVYEDAATFMYLEPKASNEVLEDRNTPITDWTGYGFIGVEFSSSCRIVYGDHTFDIIGDPRPWWNPLVGAFSHIEMDLREVDRGPALDVESVSGTAHPGVVGGVGGT